MSETELNAQRSAGVSALDAMKQALEALENTARVFEDPSDLLGADVDLVLGAANALRSAIAQAEKQEPVAWGMKSLGGDFIVDCIAPEEHAREEGGYTIPLYTAPPQRQPLTLPELAKVMASVPSLPFEGDWHLEFARAIERKHGIGGEHE